MKKLNCLAASLLFILVSASCNKCPDSGNGNTYNVNQTDLPYIIPYSDTSKVRFLKNGTDTLTYTSQGLKQTYINQTVPDDGCSHTDKLQQLSLKMKCNESEFFEITQMTKSGGADKVLLNINQWVYDNLFFVKKNIYDQNKTLSEVFIKQLTILNVTYDSATKITLSSDTSNYFISKSQLGIVKMKSNGNSYELIK